MIKYSFYILLFCFISISGKGQETIGWNGNNDYLDITSNVRYIIDENKSFSVEDVERLRINDSLQVIGKQIFNFPTSADVFWFSFSIKNPDGADLVIALNQAVIGDISLFYKEADDVWKSKHIPQKVIWYKKEMKSHLNSFMLQKNVENYYLRIDTRTTPLIFKIWNKKSFEEQTIKNLIVLAMIFGFMLFVVLYNLFLFFTSRRIDYFLYCLLIGGYILFSFTNTGYLHYLISNVTTWQWYKWLPIILQPLGMLYTIIFLNIKKYPLPFKIGIVLFIYFMSYWVWNLFLSIPTIAMISQINAMIGMLGQVGLGIYAGKKGDRIGYYFAAAYIMMSIFGALDISFINFGVPKYPFDINYITIAFLFEVIILSYLLTKRIEWENKDIIKSREETQKKLLATTLENERIIKNQNVILEQEVEQRTKELQNSLNHLKKAQAQLIQSEKMASLGELTAGIAHEIQNPLNFVNNFSEVSAELVEEIEAELEKGEIHEVKIITNDLKSNLEKINHHGKRAADIVKGMLQHSRNNSGQKELTDINVLCDEYLRLAYHGFRAKDKTFNATMNTEFDASIPKMEVVTQDLGRVILNIITNAFYAVNEKSKKESLKSNQPDYAPTVSLRTKKSGNIVEITISDNGAGIPDQIKDKIFQPFFTTKPTGQGTGLGLSLSYDVIKAHNGDIKVETEIDRGTVFTITLTI
jgi:signal transduction histidine kinase